MPPFQPCSDGAMPLHFHPSLRMFEEVAQEVVECLAVWCRRVRPEKRHRTNSGRERLERHRARRFVGCKQVVKELYLGASSDTAHRL